MNIVQSVKNFFNRKPYTMPERNRSTSNEFRQAIERMERSALQRENERERARRRYENAYLTPPQPPQPVFLDNWGSTAEPTTTMTGTPPTFQEPMAWRMGPTINPFTSDWTISSPFVPKEPIPNYQILSSYPSDDPLNQRSRIAIEGIGIFVVSTEELINSNIEDLVRRLVKMGPKKAVHIVVIGVISV